MSHPLRPLPGSTAQPQPEAVEEWKPQIECGRVYRDLFKKFQKHCHRVFYLDITKNTRQGDLNSELI